MDLTHTTGRKSIADSGNRGAYAKVAVLPGSGESDGQGDAQRGRHTRGWHRPDWPALVFTPDEWRALTARVRDGGKFNRA